MNQRSDKQQPFKLCPKFLARRHRKEWMFRMLGLSMVGLACGILITLLVMLAWNAVPGLQQTRWETSITLPAIEPNTKPDARQMLLSHLQSRFLPQTTDISAVEKRELLGLVSLGAPQELAAQLPKAAKAGDKATVTITVTDAVDRLSKADDRRAAAEGLRLSPRQLAWAINWLDHHEIQTGFNWLFFTGGDSREPELASFGGAIAGSLWMLLICLGVSFPMAVCTAIYLEEFKPVGKWVDIIEVNINNLAAVPSIVFGLLGLAVFLNVFGMPRSAPLVGGLTLALMILPTIIIATRAALKAVPPSIRDAARGLGASDLQVVVHHTLPLALPGIMTGTILGLARAIGETAPLLMIGMVAFIVDIPGKVTDPATVMPVQIYLWANNPEISFLEKTSAGILVLLGILAVLNTLAIWLRKRFEVRW